MQGAIISDQRLYKICEFLLEFVIKNVDKINAYFFFSGV